MHYKKLILFLAMFLLSLSLISAQENFDVTTKKSYTMCPCSGQGYAVVIANTGTIPSTYSLTVGEEVEQITTITPSKFSLNPGQAAQAVVSLNSPCDWRGLLTIDLFIATNKGMVKGLKQQLQFTDCFESSIAAGEIIDLAEEESSVIFKPHEGAYNLCADEKAVIPLLIKNEDQFFDNTYSADIKGVLWASLSPKEFPIKKSSSGVLLTTLNPSEDDVGEYQLTVETFSLKGEKNTQKTLDVEVRKCYDLSVDLEQESDTLCAAGLSHFYDITLNNKGILTEDITLEIEGESWVTVDVDSHTLLPGEEKITKLIITPDEEVKGVFDVVVHVVSSSNTSRALDNILITVDDLSTCYNVEAQTNTLLKNDYNQFYSPVKIVNTGSTSTTFTVDFEGPEWITFDGHDITLNPSQSYNFNLNIDPSDDIQRGIYTSTISLSSEHVSYDKDITVHLQAKSEVVQATQNFVYYGRYYFYVLLGILVLILIFWKSFTKSFKGMVKRRKVSKERSERLKKAKEEKAQLTKAVKKVVKEDKKKRRKKRTIHDHISSLLIIFAIIFGLALSFHPTFTKEFFEPFMKYIVWAIGGLAFFIIIYMIFNALKKELH